MIPVDVGQEDMRAALAPSEVAFKQIVAQPMQAHARVEDECVGALDLNFEADGIAPVDLGVRVGGGHLCAGAPKLDLQG
jgi:hypothetical protein